MNKENKENKEKKLKQKAEALRLLSTKLSLRVKRIDIREGKIKDKIKSLQEAKKA